MKNLMKEQVSSLFENFHGTMMGGLWFSGYSNEGEYKMWHENGQLYKHCFYTGSIRNGEYKLWHDNGQLYKHCFFKDGFEEGEYKKWDRYGKLEKHCFFKEDNEYTIEDAKKLFPEGPWLK